MSRPFVRVQHHLSAAGADAEPAFHWRDTTPAQRKTLWAAGLGWLLDAFDVMLYSLVVTALLQTFHLSKTAAGLLNTVTLVASAIGSLIFGLLADRFGRARLLSISILVYSLCTFACGLARSVGTLALFRFLLGLGMGGEWNTGAALIAESWPTAWRGRAMGLVQSSWAVGYALAALVAGLLLPRFGWRSVFFVGVAPALLGLWIQRHVPEPALWVANRGPEHATAHRWGPYWPRLLTLGAMNTCGMFAWWGLFTWLPAYLALPAAQGGRSLPVAGVTGFLILLNLCGMLPGYLCFGYFADRFGRKPTLLTYLALAALCVPWFASERQPAVTLVAAIVTAFFGTGFFTGSAIIGSELFPTAFRATAMGLSYNTARGLSALAPLVIGRLGEQYALSHAFLACAVAFALAAACGLALPESGGRALR